MKRFWVPTLVILIQFASPAHAFDDLEARLNIDVLYHYSRLSRAFGTENLNFLSTAGGMLQMEYTDRIGLFSRYYVGGDIAFFSYEPNAPTRLDPNTLTPYQAYVGAAQQFGDLKNFELFGGAGVSSEYFEEQTGLNSYATRSTQSARIHAGFTYRLLSVVGSVAQLLGRFSYPVTPVKHENLKVTYLAIVDGTFRLRFHYNSIWSLYGGIRFEQFDTETDIEYFTTRIYAGIGFHL